MRNGPSLRLRLLASFAAVIALALVIPSWYAQHVFNEEIVDDATSGAMRELRLVGMLTREHGGFDAPGELQRWVADLGDRLDVRITYVREDGQVLADSDVAQADVGFLDNHANRPEIIAAWQQDFGYSLRHSDTLDRHLIYAARQMRNVPGLPDGFLRLALPYTGVQDRLHRLERNFLLVMALVLVLSGAISWGLSHRLSRSLREMAAVAQSIGDGNYDGRIRNVPGAEFSALAKAINAMAASIGGQIRTITGQKSQLEAMLNSMREGVMVLDTAGRILRTNSALDGILEGAYQAVGRRPLEVMTAPELQDACDRVLAGQSQDGMENLQIEPRRGMVFDVGIVRLESDGELGALLVFHDISELKRLERVRRDFVANVSHELRTPLTTVKGYAETLLDNPGADGKRVRSFLEIIVRNADHMAKMVEDLLSLSRLEDGKLAMEPKPIDAAPALGGALKVCAKMAADKGVTLDNALPDEGVRVMADHDRLVQVFRNLLENAVRYSPQGSSVRVEHRTDGGMVRFSVLDAGPGVPRADRERVFERFYRVEKHRKKDNDGSSGLGLAICRHIVERHGGRIWVESPVADAVGSGFHFTLPAAAEDLPA